MTDTELIRICRESLVAYAIAQWQGYKPAAHHYQIAAALQRVARGECKRLMIFAPPRHGKSMLTSEYFPAWFFGNHPDKTIIHVTYAAELAEEWGRKIRNQIADPMYRAVFPGISLATDSRASDRFSIWKDGRDERGAYIAAGIGGPITGRGAHVLLIDDPLKNREEADSELIRKKHKDWYTSTAYTRLMPGGAIVIMQTRWHEDDLSGWLREEHADEGWEVLDLPAIDESEGDPKALWPASYPLEALYEIRRAVGPRDWLALYQQRPRPEGGGEFKEDWIQYYGSLGTGSHLKKLILVDPASGKRKDKENDFTSIWVVGLGSDENFYVLDMVRDRLNLVERTAKLFALVRKYRPYEVRYEEYGMQADIQHIKSKMEELQYRFPLVPVGGTTPKENRIRRMIPAFYQRRMWFPREHPYTDITGKLVDLVKAFIEEEYKAFPVGRHDDMMDALARLFEPERPLQFPGGAQDIEEPQAEYGVLDPMVGF